MYYKDVRHDVWKAGKVLERQDEKVHLIQSHDGGSYMKHIDQLISGLVNPHVEPSVSSAVGIGRDLTKRSLFR